MDVLLERVLLSVGFIGIISNSLTLLVCLISRRSTPTDLYLIFASLLMLLEQFVNSTWSSFHSFGFDAHIYISSGELLALNLLFFALVWSKVLIIIVVFLIDHFRWINNKKWTALGTYLFALLLFSALLFRPEVIVVSPICRFIMLVLIMLLVSSVLLLLLHKKLKIFMSLDLEVDDDERRSRKILVRTFFCALLASIVIFAIEYYFLKSWICTFLFVIAFCQILPLFLLIVSCKANCSCKKVKFFERGINPLYGEPKFKIFVNDDGLKQDVPIFLVQNV